MVCITRVECSEDFWGGGSSVHMLPESTGQAVITEAATRVIIRQDWMLSVWATGHIGVRGKAFLAERILGEGVPGK